MNKIVFPLELNQRSPQVADLHEALLALLERAAILPNNADARQEFVEALREERQEQFFGPITNKLVSVFQDEQGLEDHGRVDERTAGALNGLLRRLGLLEPGVLPGLHVVSGRVRREDGLPLGGVRVRADHQGERATVRLGEDVTDAEGRYTIRYEGLPGVEGIILRVAAVNDDGRELQAADPVGGAAPLETVDLTIPIAGRPARERRIEGALLLEHGLPAEQVTLRLYRHDFGGQATLLAETSTLAGGRYAFTLDPGDAAQSLEVRAVRGDDEEITLSRPLGNLDGEPRVVVDLVAPGALRPLAPEYGRLVADLTTQLGQIGRLAEARESADRQDLTVLNRATGWDARLIGLAATAERLAADDGVDLPAEAVYGLLRTGLPSDRLLLAYVEPDVAEQALKTVRDAGIVALDDGQIGQIKERFTRFANNERLRVPAPGSRSTYRELLDSSGLNAGDRETFASVFLAHRGDPAELWAKAGQAGLNAVQIARLQLQGKLAFLTGNSDGMMTRVRRKIDASDPAQLVDQDFYRAEPWVDEIDGLAGVPAGHGDDLTDDDRQKLEAVIPPGYGGDSVEARRAAWAEDMAHKVRSGYPTQVVGRLIERDNADEFRLGAEREVTARLLKNAAAQGFRLGRTPVAAFLGTHTAASAGLSDGEFRAAAQQLKKLQRVSQISPSEQAMTALLGQGLTAAHDVVAVSEQAFLERYGSKFRTPEEARLVYRRAQLVSSVTYSLFTMAQKLDGEAPVYGLTAPVAVRDRVRGELVKQFPTLESLLGSLDFCECEHCRSVLSPAAYLVDLLQFVEAEDHVWQGFLDRWAQAHDGEVYTDEYMKPYDALVERRPDLPHIPLTCENTNTALPYIDVVNEILEYFVANDALAEDAARDTGDATTAELLAEPQNVIRQAYDRLLEARYPLTLPFDLWLETVRQFCDFFETPLHRILELFRPGDDLFAPAQPYDRAGTFVESLGLSPAEAAVLTDPDPLARWHELYGYSSAAEATTAAVDATTGERIDLNSVKTLSRRLGSTYQELVDIVRGGFVNPRLQTLGILEKMGAGVQSARLWLDADNQDFYQENKDLLDRQRDELPPAGRQRFDALTQGDWLRLKEMQAFEQRLEAFAQEYGLDRTEAQAGLEAIPFDEILMLADPDAGCSFDETTFRYADGHAADGIAFLKINLFVRLWRRLGWTIEEIDRALQVFVPAQAPFVPQQLARRPLQTALIYLSHLKTLNVELRPGTQGRLKLLTLWSDIATTGPRSLYARLFLGRGVLKNDPVFDDPLGRYLSDPALRITDHLPALQGALGLTAGEIEHILADDGKSLGTARLSLPNVSLLYRYRFLATALKLPVAELIALKQLSGLDPFRPLHPEPLQTLDEDHPFAHTMHFVEVARRVQDSGLSLEDLDYLLRHRFDPAGPYRPDPEAVPALLKALAEGIRAIRRGHTAGDDPGALSDEALRQELGLALPADVADRLLAMLDGTADFTAAVVGVAEADRLTMDMLGGEPAIRGLSYQAVPRQEQKLTFQGVLFDARKDAIEQALAGQLTATQRQLLADLLAGAQQQARSFFETHLQRQAPGGAPVSGFLDDGDYDLLFNPDLPPDPRQAEQVLRRRRARLAAAFMPFLQARLVRQLVVQTLAAYSGAEPVLAESLLTDERLLPGPLLASLAALGEPGVSAAFFDSDDASGEPQAAAASVETVDTALKDERDPANSARFEGYVEVPESGAYRFYIVLAKQGAEAELRFDHLPGPLLVQGTAAADGAVLGEGPEEFLELKAGVPYRFSLVLKKLNGGRGQMLVQGETLARGRLSRLVLYPLAVVDGAERGLTLLAKAIQLLQGLGLTEREARFLLTHAAQFGGLDLGRLPVAAEEGPAAEANARALFQHFMRLAGYARLKRELAGGTDGLIALFEANETTGTDKLERQVYPLIARLARRDAATVQATAEALFGTPEFGSEEPVQRLWAGLQVVERFGVRPAALAAWTSIVAPAATPDERLAIARDLKETIRARLDLEAWQRVAQPIFDRLRQRQRDALVAHVMHQRGFARQEQLYEYFMVDPGMEPVVQTSRIRLATASVQLFIQRCLLNLEPRVHPSAILNGGQWEWMKRYRVWEANRKILLFPENWLEPEFRDDKTHLFNELEGALLQGDVSGDLVEEAFVNYLQKLEELARLEIVATHLESRADSGQNVLHVIGRTFSLPHEYFYRCYAGGGWTPWEPVSAEIEGDHLAPVVWRDRLFLFWVTFTDLPDDSPLSPSSTGTKTLANAKLSEVMSDVQGAGGSKKIEAQLHWSRYQDGEWSTRRSGDVLRVLRPVSFSGPHLPFPGQVFEGGDMVVLGDDSPGGGSPRRPLDTTSLRVPLDYDVKSVAIHVTKEPFDNGEERGVLIHLKGPLDLRVSFRLAGHYGTPERASYQPAPGQPFAAVQQATHHAGFGPLQVTFARLITTADDGPPVQTQATESILRRGDRYALTLTNNDVGPNGTDPGAVEPALREILSLTRPAFYQDRAVTLFLEPSLTERTIDEWQEWVTPPPRPEPGLADWWRDAVLWQEVIVAAKPRKKALPDGTNGTRSPVSPVARFKVQARRDWLLNPSTALLFDGQIVGPAGRTTLEIRPRSQAGVSDGAVPVDVQAGSELAAGNELVLIRPGALETAVGDRAARLSVVGASGLNSALAEAVLGVDRPARGGGPNDR